MAHPWVSNAMKPRGGSIRARAIAVAAGTLAMVLAGGRPAAAPQAAGEAFPRSVYLFNHIHSERSHDNRPEPWAGIVRLSADELLEAAYGYLKRAGSTGFLAITDHNDARSFTDLSPEVAARCASRVVPLRAAEYGSRTHLGLVGLARNWRGLRTAGRYRFESQVRQAEGSGAVRIINHPELAGRDWPWRRWGEAEAVEVWNGPEGQPGTGPLASFFSRLHNPDAVRHWDEALRHGRRYTAVAGTDFHLTIPQLDRDRYLLFPANLLFPREPTERAALAAIGEGRVSLVLNPDAPRLFLRGRWEGERETFEMGASATGTGILRLDVLAQRPARRRSEARLRALLFRGSAGDGPIAEVVLPDRPRLFRWQLRVAVETAVPDFLRVEVRPAGKGGDKPASLSNPIYLNY